MPATYTYPGLYVEEVPSGVRTIAGVSTAETAFIDFFLRGPVDRPQRVTSFGDFERNYGGLDERSEASYAVQQYYLNGGQIAWIVRVAPGNPGTASVALQTLKDTGLHERWQAGDVNPNGGGISLGHPLGATGARITATLLNELDRREARYGIASMCIGFGQALAAVIERL